MSPRRVLKLLQQPEVSVLFVLDRLIIYFFSVIISVVSVPSPPIIFHANRPFLFYIEDNDGIILFVGRCLEPSTD